MSGSKNGISSQKLFKINSSGGMSRSVSGFEGELEVESGNNFGSA